MLAMVDQEPVLEIGFGTGANIDHYPGWVSSLTAVEPSEFLFDQSLLENRAAGIIVNRIAAVAETLPVDWSDRFGTVVTSFVLCGVSSPSKVVQEIYRVLKPGGRYIMIEHGEAPDKAVRAWQRRLDPVHRRLPLGCSLSLNVRDTLSDTNWVIDRWEEGYLSDLPRVGAYLYQGVLAKPIH